MATIASLVVNLFANTAEFSPGMSKAASDTRKLKAAAAETTVAMDILNASMGAVGLAVGAAAAVVGGLKMAFTESAEAEAGMAKLNQILEQTGHSAGVTQKELTDLAERLQNTTTFGDDAVIAAEAVMLAFRNVKGDNFMEAIELSADLAAFMGTDLTEAARTLGKALNDPERGITLLRRSGVMLTEQQEQLVKTLMKTNQTAAAQQVILNALAGTMGGQAEAAADTLSGSWERMWTQVKNLAEAIGNILSPVVRGILYVLEAVSGVLTFVIDKVVKLATGEIFSEETVNTAAEQAKHTQNVSMAIEATTKSAKKLKVELTDHQKFTKSAAELTAELKMQVATFGMGAREAERYKLAMKDGHTSGMEQRLLAEAKALDEQLKKLEQQKAVEEELNKLRKERDQIGKSDVDKVRQDILDKGGTSAQADAAAKLQKEINARKAVQEAIKDQAKAEEKAAAEREKIWNETMTPLAKYLAEVERLTQLGLDSETLDRAIAARQKTLQEELTKGEKAEPAVEFLQKGSEAAFRAEREARSDGLSEIARDHLEEARKQTDIMRENAKEPVQIAVIPKA